MLLSLLSVAWPEANGRDRATIASNEMPIELYDGYMAVARGSANGITNLRFLLDIGASDSAIDRRVAERLGLESKPITVTSFDKTIESNWAGLSELTFGPKRAFNVPVIVEDLSFFDRMGVHIDGVIGLDQLRRQSFVVDYARKHVSFGPVATAGMRSAPMLVNGKVIRVEMELDGRRVWMAADTGAPISVFYEDALKELAVSYRLEGRMDWISVIGRVDSRIAIVPRLRVGEQDLRGEVVLVNVPESRRLSGVSGYLGVASLESKEIAFDFENNQFLWKK
jgi:predicted aspartyl protease